MCGSCAQLDTDRMQRHSTRQQSTCDTPDSTDSTAQTAEHLRHTRLTRRRQRKEQADDGLLFFCVCSVFGWCVRIYHHAVVTDGVQVQGLRDRPESIPHGAQVSGHTLDHGIIRRHGPGCGDAAHAQRTRHISLAQSAAGQCSTQYVFGFHSLPLLSCPVYHDSRKAINF